MSGRSYQKEREKIKELRKQRKTRNQGTTARNASTIQREDDEEDDDSSYSDTSVVSEGQDKVGNVSSVNKDDGMTGSPTRRSDRTYHN